jgi:hypothetical protein
MACEQRRLCVSAVDTLKVERSTVVTLFLIFDLNIASKESRIGAAFPSDSIVAHRP